MKGTAAFSLALCAPVVSAFPRAMYEIAARQAITRPQGGAPLPLVPPPFDAKVQYVSNKGQYKVNHQPAERQMNPH